MDVYIGIDVACAKGKSLPVVICTKDEDRLVPLPLLKHPAKPPKGFGNAATLDNNLNLLYAKAAREYIKVICDGYKLNPICIGIDAPLRPRASLLHRRLAEQALDKVGISCFKTPSSAEFDTIIQKCLRHLKEGKPVQNLPHSMQLWMLAGFAIADELSLLTQCIEVYPQATARALGVSDKHKSKGGQAEKQLMAIGHHSGWPQTQQDWVQLKHICSGAIHDKVDAYSAAWIASLNKQQRTAYGEPEKEDAIWIPKLDSNGKEKHWDIQDPLSTIESSYEKWCPACGNHLFKRWPWGWDAHAAHTCKGVKGADAVVRKYMFKKLYL